MRRFTVASTKAVDCVRRLLLSRLTRAGCGVAVAIPTPTTRYLHFSVGLGERKWQGYIEVIPWLAGVASQWAGLSSTAWPQERLLALFTAQPATFASTLPWLGEDDVIGLAVCDGSAIQRDMLRLSYGDNWLYVDTLPIELVPAPPYRGVAQIPLEVVCIVGHSSLALSHVRRLKLGDVLLIQHRTQQVRCGEVTLYTFAINEEEIVMEPFIEEPLTAVADEVPKPAERLGRIPLHLEFVLHQTTLSVEALSQLSCGHVFALAPQAAQRVLIRANRMPIGQGELVDVDGRLAVEVNELYAEQPHAD